MNGLHQYFHDHLLVYSVGPLSGQWHKRFLQLVNAFILRIVNGEEIYRANNEVALRQGLPPPE